MDAGSGNLEPGRVEQERRLELETREKGLQEGWAAPSEAMARESLGLMGIAVGTEGFAGIGTAPRGVLEH